MKELTALLEHRILLLGESITSETANRIVAQLLLLDADNPDRRIDLYINSPGGSVTDGVAIVDTIHCLRAPVSTICLGQASSMAAWILAAGRRGLRYSTTNSYLMLHQVTSGFSGQITDIQVHARHLVALQKRLVAMLAEWTGRPPEQIARDTERDFYLDPEEARAYGLIDAVLGPVGATPLWHSSLSSKSSRLKGGDNGLAPPLNKLDG